MNRLLSPPAALTAGALAALLCSACISPGPYTPTRYYTLAAPQKPAAPGGAALPLTARVQRFTAIAACPVPLTFRLSDVELTYDEFNRWAGSPEEAVSAAFFAAIESQGVFGQVIPPDVDADADVTIEGRILALEQRQNGPATLALAVGLRWRRAGGYVWFRVMRKSVELPANTAYSPANIAQALSKALADVAAQCAAEWRDLPALKTKPSP